MQAKISIHTYKGPNGSESWLACQFDAYTAWQAIPGGLYESLKAQGFPVGELAARPEFIKPQHWEFGESGITYAAWEPTAQDEQKGK